MWSDNIVITKMNIVMLISWMARLHFLINSISSAAVPFLSAKVCPFSLNFAWLGYYVLTKYSHNIMTTPHSGTYISLWILLYLWMLKLYMLVYMVLGIVSHTYLILFNIPSTDDVNLNFFIFIFVNWCSVRFTMRQVKFCRYHSKGFY